MRDSHSCLTLLNPRPDQRNIVADKMFSKMSPTNFINISVQTNKHDSETMNNLVLVKMWNSKDVANAAAAACVIFFECRAKQIKKISGSS